LGRYKQETVNPLVYLFNQAESGTSSLQIVPILSRGAGFHHKSPLTGETFHQHGWARSMCLLQCWYLPVTTF